MPEVTFNPKNQCMLDDPTDGADLPSAVSSARTSNELPTPAPSPPCLAHEPGSGGTTGECTNELVRQFGGGEGGGPLSPTPLGKARPCGAELLSTLSNCGKVAVEIADSLAVEQNEVNVFDALNCAASLTTLVDCEIGD